MLFFSELLSNENEEYFKNNLNDHKNIITNKKKINQSLTHILNKNNLNNLI